MYTVIYEDGFSKTYKNRINMRGLKHKGQKPIEISIDTQLYSSEHHLIQSAGDVIHPIKGKITIKYPIPILPNEFGLYIKHYTTNTTPHYIKVMSFTSSDALYKELSEFTQLEGMRNKEWLINLTKGKLLEISL